MFELAHPLILALIPGILIWWVLRLSRTKTIICLYMEGIPEESTFWDSFPSLSQFLRMGVFTLLVLALAEPRTRRIAPPSAEEGVTMVIALDLSGSMTLKDGDGESRLDMARREIARFVQARPNDRIGLVTFGEEALTRVPPTTRHNHLQDVLGRLRVEGSQEGTALGLGIGLAAHTALTLQGPTHVVLLLTDGRNNRGSVDPLSAAGAASTLGVRIHAVGVGEAGGGDPLDDNLLRSVVRAGSGRYFRAQDGEGLREVLLALDALETAPIPETASFVFESHARVVLLGATILLVLEALASALPKGRER